MPSEIEVPILQILYPPEGSIPAAHVERVPAILQHISALATLAGDGQAPKRPRRVLDPDESATLNAKIIELRETPLPDGGVRTWDLISVVLGRQITALAARKRYAAAKKKKLEFEKLAEAALVKPREGLPLGTPRDEPDELRQEDGAQDVAHKECQDCSDEFCDDEVCHKTEPIVSPGPDDSQVAAIKAEAIRLHTGGMDVKAIAERLGVRWQWVRSVIAKASPHKESAIIREMPLLVPSDALQKPAQEKKVPLNKMDSMILEMAEKGAMDHEICLAVVRNFNENFTVMEMRQKVRALQDGLA